MGKRRGPPDRRDRVYLLPLWTALPLQADFDLTLDKLILQEASKGNY
jgi:hypothetical protein